MNCHLSPCLRSRAVNFLPRALTSWFGWLFAGGIGVMCLAGEASSSVPPTPEEGTALARASLPKDTPPAPKGYHSQTELLFAYGLKQLKLINTKPEVPPEVRETKDVEYGKVGERALLLDLYQPAKPSVPAPALVFIHGGAWSQGSRDIYKFYTVRYAQRGYVAATVGYRLSREAPFPAAVEDVKCAVRYLRANAAKYGIDPARIAAVGGSAGGHLSMMLGYAGPEAGLEGKGGNEGVSSAVQAVVNFYGPFDLTTPFAQTNAAAIGFMGGKTYAQAPEMFAKASPCTYLKAGAPPTLTFHGTIDDIVPIDQADRLAARLKQLGVPFVYDRLDGWPHTLELAQNVNDHCDVVMSRFLQEYLPLTPRKP